jgi:hypothetical protein
MIEDFLGAIWGDQLPDNLGEVRLIRDSKVDQAFYRDIWEAAGDAAGMNQEGWDAYFGVLPRTRSEGTAAAVVDTTSVLWADVDAKKLSDVRTEGRVMALNAINQFPVPPQILVDSGGGWHCYWLLDQPVLYELARPVMVWIADQIGGDHVQDKPRVLRLPGTVNWKYQPPPEARVLRFDLNRKTRFTTFDGIMPLPKERPTIPLHLRPRLDTLPEWLEELIREGAPKGARSEASFRAAIWLLRYGRKPEEIRAIFADNPDGIGAKYAEKPMWDADRWLSYTLRAASEQA